MGKNEPMTKPICFSWLNQVEFRYTLRLRVFRREMTAEQPDASLNCLLADLRSDILKPMAYSLVPRRK